jgi:2-iminobutanoate/2-iminopropanoate deaminase
MSINVINPVTVHSTDGYCYSHAVQMGGLIFVAGEVAQDERGQLVGKDDIRAQTRQVFRNLALVLTAGGSGLDLVGKLTVFTTTLAYRSIIHEVRREYFEPIGHYPASTLAVVTSLADPLWLVEIEAVATVRTAGL